MDLLRRRVKIGEREFTVMSDEQGPRAVYERVLANPGHSFLERWVNRPYWHRNHAGATRGLIKQILAEAKSLESNIS